MPLPSDTNRLPTPDRHLAGTLHVEKKSVLAFLNVPVRELDGDYVLLNDEGIAALHRYLGQVIEDHKL